MNNAQIIDRIITRVGRLREINNPSLRAEVTRQVLAAIQQLEAGSSHPDFLSKNISFGNVDKDGNTFNETISTALTAGLDSIALPRSFIKEVENELLRLVDPDTGKEYFPEKVLPQNFQKIFSTSDIPNTPCYYSIFPRATTLTTFDEVALPPLSCEGVSGNTPPGDDTSLPPPPPIPSPDEERLGWFINAAPIQISGFSYNFDSVQETITVIPYNEREAIARPISFNAAAVATIVRMPAPTSPDQSTTRYAIDFTFYDIPIADPVEQSLVETKPRELIINVSEGVYLLRVARQTADTAAWISAVSGGFIEDLDPQNNINVTGIIHAEKRHPLANYHYFPPLNTLVLDGFIGNINPSADMLDAYSLLLNLGDRPVIKSIPGDGVPRYVPRVANPSVLAVDPVWSNPNFFRDASFRLEIPPYNQGPFIFQLYYIPDLILSTPDFNRNIPVNEQPRPAYMAFMIELKEEEPS